MGHYEENKDTENCFSDGVNRLLEMKSPFSDEQFKRVNTMS
jgi:hypothetical protein